MNPLFVLSLAIVLFVAGCTKVADTQGEDVPRLLKIDQKFNKGDVDYTLRETAKYVQAYPRSFQGWCLLGWAYLGTDQLEKARECFEKSLTINPKWDNAHVGKGSMYRKMGDNDNARKCYLEAIRILPDNAEAYSSLLVIELLQGNDKKAAAYGEKAWALRKDLPAIPANLAVAYHYLRDQPNRDRYYQHAARLGYDKLQTIRDIFDGKLSIGDR